ncbi:MAG: metal ABC transporter ATP-binding protein [Acidimicrobiales bacterium]
MPQRNSPDGSAAVARGLALAYGDRQVLAGIDLDLPAGRVTTLVGPNGAGKSTLLHALAGLLRPASGSLHVLGSSTPAARSRVALVLQSSAVNDRMPVTVREVVAMGRFAVGGSGRRMARSDWEIVDASLAGMAVDDLAGLHLRELSGGQRQRVFVAQGLAQQADLLLLDEPVTGLDIVSRDRILAAVDAERAAGRTVVVSTHDLGQAALADHVVLLAGRVVAAGSPSEVLTPVNLSAAYGERLVRLADGGTVLDDTPHHDHLH